MNINETFERAEKCTKMNKTISLVTIIQNLIMIYRKREKLWEGTITNITKK